MVCFLWTKQSVISFQIMPHVAEVTGGSTDFRKGVTIEEVRTLTSGLFDQPSMFGPALGGQSIEGSLSSYPSIGVKGEFDLIKHYPKSIAIIKEHTGMTPRQYLAGHVMGKLGMYGEDEYDSEQNDDGIEFGGGFLHLTPMQMAKFGQLYLQGGKQIQNSSNDERVVSENSIDASFTHHYTIRLSSSYAEERAEGKP